MADYTHSRFDARQRRQIADGIKRHLHEVGLSRKKLVRHDLKLSTINKALTGQFSDGTLAKLEAILGRRFEPEELKGAVPNEAPVALSGYSLSTTASFQGRFAVRPRTRSVRQPACALEHGVKAPAVSQVRHTVRRCGTHAQPSRYPASITKDGDSCSVSSDRRTSRSFGAPSRW